MKHSKPRDKSPATWLAVTIILVAAVGAAFWVPLYARAQPRLGPFPFFYWYQLVLVPVIAIASWICYLMLRHAPRTEPPSRPPVSGAPSDADQEEGR
jgi:hypothetical protein